MPSRSLAIIALVALAGYAPAAEPEGWIDLLKTGPESPWKAVDKGWIATKEVKLDTAKPNRLTATAVEQGTIWVNGPTGRLPDLITKRAYGDCEVHVEFLIAKKSNSGIKFHAVYEIQILDSAGKATADLTGDDCGGIYPRADLKPNYHHIDKGIAPKVNAAKAAGEWQTLDVTFRAPKIDDKGEKTANATIVKATLNGQLIHENQEMKTPTGNNYTKKETATGPFMLQSDHGPVAWRNAKIRAITMK